MPTCRGLGTRGASGCNAASEHGPCRAGLAADAMGLSQENLDAFLAAARTRGVHAAHVAEAQGAGIVEHSSACLIRARALGQREIVEGGPRFLDQL